jgi:phospholipid/cholesterol/gamma-HCH transport system substrate-binding protein
VNPSASWYKARRRLSGLVLLVVSALLIWLSLALYNKQFTTVDMVTLHTDSTGNEMQIDATVSYRGVQVGEVRSITANGSGATLELAIQPGQVSQLPANVSAEMLPTTLFGARYVALIPPASPVTQRLTADSVITQNRSSNAIELEKVLNDLLPMLTAVQPAQLSATLTAMAQALQGRGTKLGQTLDAINTYLRQFNPQLPVLDRDIAELIQVTQTYAQAAPSIVQALHDFSVTSQTVASEEAGLQSDYATVTGMASSLDTFLNKNSSNMIQLAGDSLSTLRILARYSSEFPCVLQDLVNFEPYANKVFGQGTSQPGLHVNVHPEPSMGRYLPGRDAPVYGANTGPRCYPVPFPGVLASNGTSQPAAGPTASTAARAAAKVSVTGSAGLGLPNSPQENELINELLSPALNASPQSLPDWSSVLAGPVYRGTEVNVK